jgi:hypothetical protein
MTSAVQPAGPSAPINPAENGDSASEVVTPSSSLLPEPGAGGLTGTQDALSMMYSLVAKQGQLAMAIGENNVESASRDQQAMLAIETQAEQAQQQAEASQSGGFWHDLLSVAEDVAKVAGIVVAAAAAAVATVFTAGAAGIAVVAIAAILISSGALVSATHCLGKDSAYIGMGMEITGSIMTMGAASGAVASTALTEAVQTVSTVAQLTQGTATILAGVATTEVGKFQGESEDDAADVQEAVDAMNQQSRLVNDLIAGLKSSQESNKNALQLIAGAAQTYGQTLTTAASLGKA